MSENQDFDAIIANESFDGTNDDVELLDLVATMKDRIEAYESIARHGRHALRAAKKASDPMVVALEIEKVRLALRAIHPTTEIKNGKSK